MGDLGISRRHAQTDADILFGRPGRIKKSHRFTKDEEKQRKPDIRNKLPANSGQHHGNL
jgi:hypothetical protein